MHYLSASALLLASLAFGSSLTGLSKRQSACIDPGFLACYPVGATGLTALDAHEYTSVIFFSITTSIEITFDRKKKTKRDLMPRRDALCCNPEVDCLLLSKYNIPFCYDPDTTEFAFSDGSYGFVDTGDYFDAEGDQLNFITGDYKFVNGTTGNIYKQSTTPPNTATLKLPTRAATASVAGGKATASGSPASTITSVSRSTSTACAFGASATAASTTSSNFAAPSMGVNKLAIAGPAALALGAAALL
ncbi:MAG: hypothetical protein M1814_001815 [Vezdaea aestivalis]|nr:MAG: hypothetical protein M1814_001815 [Vezdaea aestivalis]